MLARVGVDKHRGAMTSAPGELIYENYTMLFVKQQVEPPVPRTRAVFLLKCSSRGRRIFFVMTLHYPSTYFCYAYANIASTRLYNSDGFTAPIFTRMSSVENDTVQNAGEQTVVATCLLFLIGGQGQA